MVRISFLGDISFNNRVKLGFEKNVESLDYWASSVSGGRNQVGSCGHQTPMNVFSQSRCNTITCASCDECIIKEYACPDRNTLKGIKCKNVITKEMIESIGDKMTFIKNKGYMRTAIFDTEKIQGIPKTTEVN